ncbi:MAG: UDP-N-acetylglucosamine 2-epimerase (non-hydrolyzing), partial [Rhodospirillaceae bacterium]|nr:UDP-N-acetylglucosamine 2-epimerase (non-hydrolyzing) [Rhodospirillaceae bacterium]
MAAEQGPLVDLIAGARPNFMKIAPIWRLLARADWCRVRLVHTGQHYDPSMSDAFFRDLGLPAPDRHLDGGSGTHAEQTGRVMVAYERLCLDEPPAWAIVVGDVNSTLACALAAKKLGLRVAHLEAGLRSRDMSMPEEINRVLTDRIADLLWTPSADADDNLRAEGVPAERIDRVGNVMIDALVMMREAIGASRVRCALGLAPRAYGVVTLHRPANVDEPDTLAAILGALARVAGRLPLVLPMHPRIKARLAGLSGQAGCAAGRLRLVEALGYVDFMGLVSEAAVVVTDSGGVQEETTYLGIPCITVRPSTERPVTVTLGTNRLARPDEIAPLVEAALAGDWPKGRPVPLWDGHAAERAVRSLRSR